MKYRSLKYIILGLALMILLPACKAKEEEDVYPKTIIVENPQWVEFEDGYFYLCKRPESIVLTQIFDDSYSEYRIDETKSISIERPKETIPVKATGRLQHQYTIENIPDISYSFKGVVVVDKIEILDFDPFCVPVPIE